MAAERTTLSDLMKAEKIIKIKLDDLIPHEQFREEHAQELIAQIKNDKVLKRPIAVYDLGSYKPGKDMHFVSNDLLLITRQDINRDVALRTWHGFRHQYGQKVRGQRTRSTGRTGATVGVMKKAAKEQIAAATKGAEAKPAAGAAKPAAAPK